VHAASATELLVCFTVSLQAVFLLIISSLAANIPPILVHLSSSTSLLRNWPVPAEYVDASDTSSVDESETPIDAIPVASLPINDLASSRCDTKTIKYAGSKSLTLETGEIGRLASGSIMLTAGDTMIYTNACADYELLNSDFTPLQVAYHERLSAAGRTACASSTAATLPAMGCFEMLQ
jgi:hypothetical protein